MNISTEHAGIRGVILAGGKASRMGFVDKALLKLGDREILQHVIDRARPQVDSLAISVNRNSASFDKFGLPCVTDLRDAYAGPLAGIASAMSWHLEQAAAPESWLACFPADVPVFPTDLVPRLLATMKRHQAQVTWTRSNGQVQPLFSLWSFALLPTIVDAMNRKLFGPRQILEELNDAVLEIDSECEPGSFFNINTPADLASVKILHRFSETP
ncbi:MAG: molybdenum cofactor guanylyltransferase MobA [Pseudohongiellaceae bacterium]